MITNKKTITFLSLAAAWIISLAVLIPAFLVLINSFKTHAEANLMNLSLPSLWEWNNYANVMQEGRLVRSFVNSFIISGFAVFFSTWFSAKAAFVLERNNHRYNRWVYQYFLLGLVAPLNMVTIIRVLKLTHLMNSYQGIIILYISLLLSFSIFLYYGFIKSVPRELDEAAIMDGAGPWTLFYKAVLPLLLPVTITVIIINFMNVWNDFIVPLYILNNSEKWTMTLSIYNFFGRRESDWNYVFTDVVLTTLPVLIVYVICQKFIISGMTAGAIKG
jgi:raffinose/stachyose/melibiose transport system permease protein